MQTTLIIGLTGQTGSGKSLVADIFEKTYKYNVIDCDKLVHEIQETNTQLIKDLVDYFSIDILSEDKKINRKALGVIVFSDKKKLNKLNEIIFPYIMNELEQRMNTLRASGAKVIILDAPTLFESGLDNKCSFIVSVVADEDIRLHRICKRDNLTEIEAINRIKSQKSETFYKENSHFIINNSGSFVNLEVLVNAVSKTIDALKQK